MKQTTENTVRDILELPNDILGSYFDTKGTQMVYEDEILNTEHLSMSVRIWIDNGRYLHISIPCEKYENGGPSDLIQSRDSMLACMKAWVRFWHNDYIVESWETAIKDSMQDLTKCYVEYRMKFDLP